VPPAVALAVVGLLSIQPPDSTYVGPGSPYLTRGLGGAGFGAGAALNIVTPERISTTVDVGIFTLSGRQGGRLIPGPGGDVRLTQTIVSGLVGQALRSGVLHVQGGPALIFGSAAYTGVSSAGDDSTRVGLTAAMDWINSPGVPVTLTLRYTFVPRSEGETLRGIGPHVLRVGVGVRVRMN
jgi:hypothetical protein